MKNIFYFFFVFIFNGAVFSQWIPVGVNTPLGGDIMSFKVYNSVMYAGGTANLFRSSDDGVNWSGCFQQPVMHLWSLAKTDNNVIFCGSFTGSGVFKSTNNGLNWSACSPVGNNVIYDMASSGNTVYAMSITGGLFKSSNFGTNWINTGMPGFKIFCSGNRIYTAGSGLFVSTNEGLNWSLLRNEAFNALYAEDSLIFAGAQDIGLLRSGNYGINFTNVLPGQIRIKCIYKYLNNIFVSADSLDAYFVNRHRFYYSTDNGLTFFLKNQGLDSISIQDMIVYNNFLYIANGNYGSTNVSLYKRLLQDVIGIKKTNYSIPDSFSLEQNFPNPFNSGTVIRFSLPKSGLINLKIYDIQGKEISELINQQLSPGVYETYLSSDNLPSGIYFYTLSAEYLKITKSMILIK
jgi:hypothetical protein